jgi:cytochrome c oxidase cbb3-type subunit 3
VAEAEQTQNLYGLRPYRQDTNLRRDKLNNISMSTPRIVWLLSLWLGGGMAHAQLPDGPHKETALKLCGTCHAASIVLGRGLTRDQWGEVVSNMISKGAKGSPDEFNQVVDYLATALPAKNAAANAARRKPTGGLSAGPQDRHVVDEDSAKLGKTIYFRECITCHGPNARGANPNNPEGQKGTDLVRSLVVLHDRYGNELGPFLKKGHPMQSGASSSGLNPAQVQDLANFLHLRFEDTLHRSPSKPLNVLTGDAKAGEAYFNGLGKCNSCHSPTGDLAHIASKYDPPALQLKFLFPRNARFGSGGSHTKPVTVTLTQPDGQSVTGELIRMDDFTVALHDSDGQYHSWTRTPELKVQKNDPYETHIALLDQYTDKNMHDIVAYLETLK